MMTSERDAYVKKPVDSLLGMVKHPLPTQVYLILGVKCIFSYSFWHLCLFAFTFTYLNIVTLFEFDVYPTLMTGNYFNSALDIRAENYNGALFRLSLIASCTFLSTALDSYLVTKLQSRHNAFAILLLLLIISVVVTELASGTSESKYCLCILCVTGGALVHWSQKLGYNCSAMTGNLFKLSEFFFKWFNGYDLGGPKMNGEIMIIIGIMFWSVIGAMAAVSVTKYHEVVSLYPLLGTVPLHLYLSGCLEVWGLIPSSEEHLSSSFSPLWPEAEKSDDSGVADAAVDWEWW
jgi:uncharacterized membrane protein YoaK (UPF0700 family)